MIAQITDLLVEALQLSDRSLVTVLSMVSVEQFASTERQHYAA
jgi:hypothetical protein